MSSPSHRAAAPAGRPGLVLLASTLGIFIALLDVNVVNVALPSIRQDLSASLNDLEWVVNAYVLALAVLIVSAGRFGDLYGRRLVYGIGLLVFMAGSAICAAAGHVHLFGWSDINVLHGGRVVQGLGGACIMPLSLAMIYNAYDGKKRGMAIGIWGAVSGLATAIGPLVGGLLVEHVNWESIFLLNLPVGAIALMVTFGGTAESRDSSATGGIDLPGVVLAAGMLLCLNLALINGRDWGWTSGSVLALFTGAAVLLLLFLLVEMRSRSPLVDPQLFASRTFTGSAIAGFSIGAGTFAMFFFIALYLQNGLGLGPLDTGLRFLPLSGMLILAAPISSRLVDRVGPKPVLLIGMTAVAAALLLLLLLDPHGGPDSWTRLLPGFLLAGLGLGMAFPVVSGLTVSSAPPHKVGVASSLGTMVRQVGISHLASLSEAARVAKEVSDD